MKYLFLIMTICTCNSAFSQPSDKAIRVSDDVELIKLSESVYVHVSYRLTEKWGRIAANGLIYIDKTEALLFDTPWTEAQTEALVSWISDSLDVTIKGLVPNHWHDDCMGGLDFIKGENIKTYANKMTIDIAKSKGLSAPDIGFNDSLQLHVGGKEAICYYLGAAHSFDNIVVWIPSEKLLFAGCVLKGLNYNNIGFVGDGDLNEYPTTLNRILTKFPKAKTVIPGHGNYGGIEIIQHNIKLVSK